MGGGGMETNGQQRMNSDNKDNFENTDLKNFIRKN